MAQVAEISIPAGQRQRLPGNIAEVAVLAYPVVLQTLSDTLLQVVDSAIVGHVGVTELGAVGFGGIVLWTMMTGFVGAATGVQTFVAQAYGAGERGTCGRWVWQALYVLLPAALAWFAFVAVIFGPLLRLLGPSAEIQAQATAYAHARLFGAPAVVAGVVFTSFFRGLGDTRTPLAATIGVNVFNGVLAYGLVFGRWGLPALGVVGAGTATAIANWMYAASMAAAYFLSRRARPYSAAAPRPQGAAMWRFVRTGAPIGGQWLLDMISFALFSTIVARMGDKSMAATQAMIQLLALSFMQAYGISIGSAALVGRYIGARDLAAAERTHRSALRLGIGLAVAIAALFVAAPDLLLRLFTTDAELLALGRPLLALGALFQMIDAVGIVTAGSLRGAGDTRWPFMAQTALAWLVRLPVVYTMAVILEGGLFGAWLGELAYVSVLGATLIWRFRAGAWRAMRV